MVKPLLPGAFPNNWLVDKGRCGHNRGMTDRSRGKPSRPPRNRPPHKGPSRDGRDGGAPKKPKNARQVALVLLKAVMDKHLALDDACHNNKDFGQLSDRDRGFAKLLVLTVCRHMGAINRLLDGMLAEPPKGDGGQVKMILQLGVAQLVYLKTPAHAAVGQTVELAGKNPLFKFKGLINAVLRRLDREGEALMAPVLEDQAVNARPWLWRAWEKSFGADGAAAIAAAHSHEAPLDITVKSEPDVWAEKLGADLLPTGSLRLQAGTAVPGLEGYKDGTWWVQDAAASLPVRLLGDLSGKTVVDLCAAPGGKTMQLIAAGARVIAVDRHGGRLKRLQTNLDRVGQQAEVIEADAESWRPAEPVDMVVLDAPCTATGTIRRHPELQWIRTPNDVAELASLQKRLLQAAPEMLKPGGELVYVTCSLQPEEGESQIEAFLSETEGVELLPFTAADLPGLPQAISEEGYLRCLPSLWSDQGGMDGFFAARIKRQ